jgi:hypothetical protein
MTIDDARKIVADAEAKKEAEKLRLAEKVLCAEIVFPKDMQDGYGITGYTMKYEDMLSFIEEELDVSDATSLTFEVTFSMRTNKWIESIPEYDG